jgi:hypothetical protein
LPRAGVSWRLEAVSPLPRSSSLHLISFDPSQSKNNQEAVGTQGISLFSCRSEPLAEVGRVRRGHARLEHLAIETTLLLYYR